jgi:hypothetical protein
VSPTPEESRKEPPREDVQPDTVRRDDVQRTRAMKLPPVPPPPAASSPGVLADQPTDELTPPDPRQLTRNFGAWQPLHPRVVARPRSRSRTPYVLAALVLLVIVAGIVVALMFRR